MYSYKEVETALEKELLSDALYKMQRLAEERNCSGLARWCSYELNGYSGSSQEELDASNSYRKVPVEWRDAFGRAITISNKLAFLNSMPIHLGVADIEGFSTDGVLMGYPEGIELLQPLCNGPIAGAYFPPDQLRYLLKRIKLMARSKLHDCIPRSVAAEIEKTKTGQRPRPGFIDSLIILFTSAAAVIFLFWITSQTLRLDTFVTVPDFIQNSFKAIWTSVATGAAGIGLAAYKALTRSPNQPTPNYLVLIGLTTGSMLLLVFLLLYVLASIGPHVRLSPPPDTELIEIGSPTSISHTLNVKSDPSSQVFYELKGHYSVKGRTVEGSVETGIVSIDNYFKALFPMHFHTLFVSLCYIGRTQGNDFLNWYPDSQFPQWSNSVRIDFDASPGLRQNLPAFNFKIDLPAEIRTDKVWICSGLANSAPGYYPARQVASNSR